MSDRSIGFHRLVEACGAPGCPLCRCLEADTRRYLATVLYEHVTDPESRARLRASWGFCHGHARMLGEAPDAAFGAAILCEDLLRIVARRFQRWNGPARGGGRALLRRLSALARRDPATALVELHGRRGPCPACAEQARAEGHYLDTLLRRVRDPALAEAYAMSGGLCVPHALAALDRARRDPAGAELIARTLAIWGALRQDLAGFIGKHDHRNREPYTDAERGAHLRAIEALTGGAALSTGDRRTRPRSARTKRRPE